MNNINATKMTFKVHCQIVTKSTNHGCGYATRTVKASSADAALKMVHGLSHGKKPAIGNGFKLNAYEAERVA